MEKQKHAPDRQGAIVGVGNVLQGDDGIGVTILKYLEAAFRFPPQVSLIDGGTAGAGLQSAILGKQWLLIIDALAVPGNPGEIRLIAGRDILARPADLKLSPHQVSFFDLLQLMELRGLDAPEFSILGIVPQNTGRRYGIIAAGGGRHPHRGGGGPGVSQAQGVGPGAGERGDRPRLLVALTCFIAAHFKGD